MAGKFRKEVVKLLAGAVSGSGFGEKAIDSLIEVPDSGFGDFAFPCFALAKAFRKSPQHIAAEIASRISATAFIGKVESKGPYVNFFIRDEKIAGAAITAILKQKASYGNSGSGKGEKVVVEYPSPNTNKPLHLGHVRNMLLGQSVSKILEFAGYKVYQVNLNNDRGVHICQAMLAYGKFGKGRQPGKKPDHFVGDFYVLFQREASRNPALNDEVQEMLVKWEAGDKETLALWEKINGWALRGFKETYEAFGIRHDRTYNESEHYGGGKELVMQAHKKGLLERDEKGNIMIDFEKHNVKLPPKILLRSDGTSIYMTQDINLAKLKFRDFKMDKSVYVVGSEQILHFRQLFKILELLDIYKGGLFHLAHGMVYLPEGKMKSREGKVVDADDMVEEMIAAATSEVKSRYPDMEGVQIKERSRQIGMAALRFFMLKYDPLKDFVFNPKESISFDGETGPYVQYAHARICSIIEKYGKKVPAAVDYGLLKEKEERLLIRLLAKFPETVEAAASNYRPLLVARHLLDLSQAFSNYYHSHQILKADAGTRNARLQLIAAVRQVLENGLQLLSIDAPEKM